MNSTSLFTVAVIGTAGRKKDPFLTSDRYGRIESHFDDLIDQIIASVNKPVRLVSGGAAWMDHLAVRAFNRSRAVNDERIPTLHLHLPANYDADKSCYIPWSGSPHDAGARSNQLHISFTGKANVDSFGDLTQALFHPNCVSDVSKGFEKRNKLIAAEPDGLIAFFSGGVTSFFPHHVPAKEAGLPIGGTSQTWDLATAKVWKMSVNIQQI